MRKGTCYICGAELGKTAMKNHLLKVHSGGQGQECRLLKIEGAYNKDYWLFVDMAADKTLRTLDTFLRKIWLECCGHLSEFRGAGKSSRIGDFSVGDRFLHLYDMGSTTETLVTVIGTTWRPPQREAVRLLARNVPPQFICADCGAPAAYFCTECQWDIDNPFYCETCARGHEHEEMLLPVTNSPRMGVCGYTGELDTFAFTQPLEAPASRTADHKKPREERVREHPQENAAELYPDELYDLAFAFRDAKLWDKLYEDELFAVPLATGGTGCCSVMGMSGEHFALTVYPGEQGLRSFRCVQDVGGAIERFELPNELKMREYMLSQLCIQCSFENKSMLSPEELASVRAYGARRGVKFQGSHSFPQFVTYRPAMFPTQITSEEDIQILCEALRAAVAVNGKLREANWIEPEKEALGFSSGRAASRPLPLLARDQDAYTWSVGTLPDAAPPTYPSPVLRDDILLARLKRAKRRNTSWVCDVVMCPQPIQENEGDTPVFPYVLLAVDKETEAVLPPAMVCDYEKEADTLLHSLGERMLEFCVPRRMIVTDDRTHAFLENFTSSLGIQLARAHEDELLEALESDFAEIQMEGGDEPDEEEAAELLGGFLMNLDDTTLLQLPQPVWEAIRAEISKGFASVDVKDRFCELNEKRRRQPKP